MRALAVAALLAIWPVAAWCGDAMERARRLPLGASPGEVVESLGAPERVITQDGKLIREIHPDAAARLAAEGGLYSYVYDGNVIQVWFVGSALSDVTIRGRSINPR